MMRNCLIIIIQHNYPVMMRNVASGNETNLPRHLRLTSTYCVAQPEKTPSAVLPRSFCSRRVERRRQNKSKWDSDTNYWIRSDMGILLLQHVVVSLSLFFFYKQVKWNKQEPDLFFCAVNIDFLFLCMITEMDVHFFFFFLIDWVKCGHVKNVS